MQPAKDSLSHDPLINEKVGGRYVIERLIGRGGVGLVYLASDTQDHGRKVVVKVLAPHWAHDADAVARFDREAKRMAKLDHPNVVRMFSHGHHGNATYIVMEFLDGEPLRRYLNRCGRLSFEAFIPIASQILAGVGYVHARNTMLRDIKPPNIMLCERDGKANHVKLLDFGLAKLIEEESEITKAHVIGTAGYLAPEQIKGERADVRVDVYALGILFFILLGGESPIVGENDGAILFNHVHGTPKQLVHVLPPGHDVPESVIELIHQCLSKDPNDRPHDANEMAEILFETVHPSLFVLPTASEETRLHAREYWQERMKRGANAVSLDDDDDDDESAEHTNPVLKRSLMEVRQAAGIGDAADLASEAASEDAGSEAAVSDDDARAADELSDDDELSGDDELSEEELSEEELSEDELSEEELSEELSEEELSEEELSEDELSEEELSEDEPVQARLSAAPPPPPSRRPLVHTGPAATLLAAGRSARAIAVAPAPSARAGSTLPPVGGGPAEPPKPSVRLADDAGIGPSGTQTGMPQLAIHSPATSSVPTIEGNESSPPRKSTILGIPARDVANAVPREAPAVVVPRAHALSPGVPEPTVRAGSGQVLGERARRQRVPTIGTAVLKATASKRRVVEREAASEAEAANDDGLEVDTNRVAQNEARRMAETPPQVAVVPAPMVRTLVPTTLPPSAPTTLPPSAPTPSAPTPSAPTPATSGDALLDAPAGRTVAMDADEVKRAAVAGAGGRAGGPYADLSAAPGMELIAEDSAAAAALFASSPVAEPPSKAKFSLLLALGGVAALTLGGLTAWAWMGRTDATAPEPSVVAADVAATAQATPTDAAGPAADAEPPPPDEARVIQVARPESEPGGASDRKPNARPAAADLEVGAFEIAAPTGAVVAVDGRVRGTGPFAGKLAVGRHEVRVEAAGFEPWTQSFEVKATGTTSVTPELRRKVVGTPKKTAGGKSTATAKADVPASAPPNSDSPKPDPSKSDPPKPDPSKSDPPKSDPPKQDPPKQPAAGKDDVFMNTDTGKPSGGIFLPVGKGK